VSGPGVIEHEPDGICELCGATTEVRPYGPNGEEVCFACGMRDRDAAERGFRAFVMGDRDALAEIERRRQVRRRSRGEDS
jgi:hypothetical protein